MSKSPSDASDDVVVDLRSDTVTQPSADMRTAMAGAAVGDDVFGEDPSVNSLEARVAALLGKQSALFLPSGTMANLVATLVHCRERGSELLCGDKSHMFLCEQGGAAQLGGVMMSTVHNLEDGTVDLAEVEARVRGARPHEPRTVLLALENTHNHCGGKVLEATWLERAAALCRRLGLALHLDGARLWNASEALRVEPRELAAPADSLSVCFSKGLGAPVGSALAGTADFIARARRVRKALGGGMRQAGVLAAAAHVALDEGLPALYSDHRRAQYIATEVSALGVRWVRAECSTNVVLLRLSRHEAAEVARRLEGGEGGAAVRALALEPRLLRLVLHRDVNDELARRAVAKLRAVLSHMDTL